MSTRVVLLLLPLDGDVFNAVCRTEGAAGMYRGFIPNLLRNSIMNMAELVTYDCDEGSWWLYR